MACDIYRQHELGEITAETFTRHARACAACQRLQAQDEQLLQIVRSLDQPASSPFLWAKIENTLRVEQQREIRWSSRPVASLKWLKYAVAASIVFAVGLAALFMRKDEAQTDAKLLAASALQNVAQKEKEYEAAIAQLERATSPQLAQLPTELMLLYRDRLATIDTQIARCREALAENPGNAHLRRYMLMALQDKKATLQELTGKRDG